MVNSYGHLRVSAGGTASNIVENGGVVTVLDGATAAFTPNSFSDLVLSSGQTATVHSGTTANSTTVSSDGSMQVYSGGTASATMLNSGGSLYVSSGGTANYIGHPWTGKQVTVQTGATVTHTIPNGIYYGNTTSNLISSYDSDLSQYNIPSGNSLVVVGKTV